MHAIARVSGIDCIRMLIMLVRMLVMLVEMLVMLEGVLAMLLGMLIMLVGMLVMLVEMLVMLVGMLFMLLRSTIQFCKQLPNMMYCEISVGKRNFNMNLRMIATTSNIVDQPERIASFHLCIANNTSIILTLTYQLP